jgi:nitrate/TMAO reductase-like tetraheme cytochrome c subunit
MTFLCVLFAAAIEQGECTTCHSYNVADFLPLSDFAEHNHLPILDEDVVCEIT